MSSSLLLAFEVLISLGVSALLIRALSRHLAATLCRLCPDEAAASFWLTYTQLMLLAAPLLLVLLVDLALPGRDPALVLRLALFAAVGGSVLGLRRVGKVIGRFVSLPAKESAL